MTTDEKTAGHHYRVKVVRSGRWWAITVPGLPGAFSQARRLDQVEAMAREAIALFVDIDETDVGGLDLEVTPPGPAVDVLANLQASLSAADQATEAAAAARRDAAQLLHDEGLPFRDVGRLVGLSHQRVSQILAD